MWRIRFSHLVTCKYNSFSVQGSHMIFYTVLTITESHYKRAMYTYYNYVWYFQTYFSRIYFLFHTPNNNFFFVVYCRFVRHTFLGWTLKYCNNFDFNMVKRIVKIPWIPHIFKVTLLLSFPVILVGFTALLLESSLSSQKSHLIK